MDRNTKRARAGLALAAIFLLVSALAGCGAGPRHPSGSFDTPEHHYRAGLAALDAGNPEKAAQDFDRALEMNPEYSPALSGKGVALAMLGRDDEALDLIDDGMSQADSPDEEVANHIAHIRVLTQIGRRGGFERDELRDETKSIYMDAKELMDDDPRYEDVSLFYYQGEAYLAAYEFDSSEEMFKQVLLRNKGYTDQAERRMQEVQDMKRAAPQTSLGKKIASVENITRADMAALLVEELDVARFYGRTAAPEPAAFKTPAETIGYQPSEAEQVVDILNHPLRTDMELVISYGVRGLMPFSDNLFRPQAVVSRAEAAMIFEDVIVRATGDSRLATQFIGQQSPFSDVRADHPAFNAIMLCTTRGLFEAGKRSGEFNPGGTFTGTDAVLAINRLRAELDVL